MSFVMSVRPTDRPSLCAHGKTRLPRNLLCFFRKYAEKIKVLLKYDKNYGYYHEDLCTYRVIFLAILLVNRNVSDKICREYQNTHLLFINFFPKIVSFMS
jgi:hypothetical protein